MTIVVSSPKRNRLYVRRFDHEAAARLRAAGVPPKEIADRFGVSVAAVYRATTPGSKERAVAYGRRWRTTVCEVCGGPAVKLVAGKKAHNRDGRVLCNRCRGAQKTERLRFDAYGRLIAVRCCSLECANGERWQPPANFSRGPRHRSAREGGVHGLCRACQTRARRLYREARKVPCRSCGEPCLPASEKGARGRDTGLCRRCWRISRRKNGSSVTEASRAVAAVGDQAVSSSALPPRVTR